MQTARELPPDTINKIALHRVHRIGAKINAKGRPIPIMAKFEHYKQKEKSKRKGAEGN